MDVRALLADPAILALVTAACSVAAPIVLLVLLVRGSGARRSRAELLALRGEVLRQSDFLREGFGALRGDSGRAASELRRDVAGTMHTMGEGLANRLADLFAIQAGILRETKAQIAELTTANERRQLDLQALVDQKLTEMRGETAAFSRELTAALTADVKQMNEAQRDSLHRVVETVSKLTQQHKAEQEVLRTSVEGRLDAVRRENGEKLEQMRRTVDEKLQETLHARVTQSFAAVSEQLERVHRSVGEMQQLAAGVGDLKRVLTNVKSRGTFGEVSLGALLDETLTAEQYGKNVEIRPASGERVEFAVRLPGQHDDSELWLPIDCKFPTAQYERLTVAIDIGDAAGVEEAHREIEAAIKTSAKTIGSKYVVPPHSTDFAILFLPTEGLYAEVVRRPGLVDFVQREHRVMIAGPTTLWALLSSLRMGFRTLAIQKRSGEVWQILGAVKTEFGKYGEALDKVRQRLDQASEEIEKVQTRRRAMDRKLRAVDQLPDGESAALLTLPGAEPLRLVGGDEGRDESAA